jgi:hypothetical protein
MSAMTDFLEQGALNYLFRSAALTQPTSVNIGLWVGNPGDDLTGGAEVVGTNYARVSYPVGGASWSNPSPTGSTQNLNIITFPTAGGAWAGPITHVVVFDHLNNPLFYGALAVPKTVNNLDTFTIPANNLVITLQ